MSSWTGFALSQETDESLDSAGRRISAMGDKSPKKEAAKAPKKSIKEKRRDKQAKRTAKGTGSL
jgi:hypothetical protein